MGMNATAVQRLYVAYFNRPADPVSLQVYENLLPTDRLATQAELQVVADTYFSGSAEYTALYAGMGSSSIVDQLYQNIFGRSAELEGLIYWAAELTAGTQTIGQIALQLSYSAQGTDLDTVNNRIEAATSFTGGLNTAAEVTGYSGTSAAASARTWLQTVTDEASKTTAIAGVDTAVSDAVAAGNVVAGTTTLFTTGADDFTGGTGNDTFKGGVSATAGDNTLTLVDSVNGGDGDDVLEVTAAVLATDITVGSVGVTNIETVKITTVDGDGTVGTDAALFAAVAGITTVQFGGNSNITVTALPTGSAMEMFGDGNTQNGIMEYAYSTASAAQTLNFSGGTSSAGTASVTATASAGVTTVTINSTGAANAVDTILLDSAAGGTVTALNINATTGFTAVLTAGDFAATSALDINGAGAVNIGATGNFRTIDASGNSGGVTMGLGTVTTSFAGSTGNDVITSAATATTVAGAVDGGEGFDTLVIAAVANVDTAAEGAEYTGFDALRVAGTLDTSFVSAGMTALQVTGTSNLTNLTAALAGNTSLLADAAGTTFALTTATGTSDVISITLGTGLTTSEATDFTGALTVTGFETLNLTTNAGPSATLANQNSAIASITGANLTAINLSGQSVTLTNAATTLATTIDGTALTGVLTVAGNVAAGTVVSGGAGADIFTAGTNNGATYNGNAGNDGLTATVAQLVATGENDTGFDGGADTDTLTVSTAASTLTDNHFTNITGLEALTTSGTGDTSISTGGSFKAAFATGITITTAALADESQYTFNGGLYNQAVTITTNGTNLLMNAAGENQTVITSSGDDTITIGNDATHVGAAGASSGIIVNSGAGADTIVFDYGNLLVTTGTQVATIDAGTGADVITKGAASGTASVTADNSTSATSAVSYTLQAGDSLATAAGHDTITGFEIADGINQSDVLNFGGNAAVGTIGTSVDFGTIKSHSITAGIASFDDAAAFGAALVISDTNLADVVGYLAANTATNDAVGFTFDSTGNGVADSSMVYYNDTTDSLVLLVGVTAGDAIVVAQGVGANDIVVL
jgi:hypothetical protein